MPDTIADEIITNDISRWLQLHAQALAAHDVDRITEAAVELDHLLRPAVTP